MPYVVRTIGTSLLVIDPRPDETGAAHGAEVGAAWYRDGMDSVSLPQRRRVTDADFAKRVHRAGARRKQKPNGCI